MENLGLKLLELLGEQVRLLVGRVERRLGLLCLLCLALPLRLLRLKLLLELELVLPQFARE